MCFPADIVQDVYIRELKNYKITPEKPSDAEGNTKKWSAPKPPKAPESAGATLADELKAYETQAVEVEGQATAEEAAGAPAAEDEDWFEEELAFPKEEETHH